VPIFKILPEIGKEFLQMRLCLHLLENLWDIFKSYVCFFFVFLVLRHIVGFTSHRHSIGHIATFQLYWWRRTSGALLCIISGTNGHLSRTTDVPQASWKASSHERIQSPCRDSNPQRWGASGLKSTTLTTRLQKPFKSYETLFKTNETCFSKWL
jgi:hypothetical protein